MEVNIVNLQQLFAAPTRYEIPPFQRPYIWNDEDQWEPLWEDIRNTSEHFLEDEGRKKHFLGAVVLQQKPVPTPNLQTRLVVDGQQRLTTLQLVLDAVQEVFEEREYEDASKRLEFLVLNNEAYHRNNPDHAFKVWPTSVDQDAFRHAMKNDLPVEEYRDSLIVGAHEFFKEQIRQWLDGDSNSGGSRAIALEQTVTSLLELVVIDLSTSDDPHIIFETLNARGTPLLESDLIKNMMLYEAKTTEPEMVHEDVIGIWPFNYDWWREEIRQGRIVRPRIDVFLNYWLAMRTQEEVAADRVFRKFREYFYGTKSSVQGIAADLSKVGHSYRVLEGSSDSDLDKFLYRWRIMQAGVLTPVLLWLLSSEVPRSQMNKCIRALESHQVRRMVCRMTTRGYNRIFIALVGRLEEEGAECAGDTAVDYLKNIDSDVGVWPDDHQLQEAFLTQPLYRLLTRGRLRIVLEGIEEELRTYRAEVDSAPSNLTIEHIMPQQWRAQWEMPSGSDEEAGARRDRLIHSIGNLTLVNNRLNPSLSNDTWTKKREALREHSTLFLNKQLLEQYTEVWNERSIADRARRLGQAASRVWPYADEL